MSRSNRNNNHANYNNIYIAGSHSITNRITLILLSVS